MVKFLKFLGKSLYSNKEASDIYKKPKWYAFIVFALALLILAIPIIKFVNTFEYDDMLESYQGVPDVLRQYVPTSDIKIKDGMLSTKEGAYVESFVTTIKDDLGHDIEIKYFVKVLGNKNEILDRSNLKIEDQDYDNVIWFGKTEFYARFKKITIIGTEEDNIKKTAPYELSGSYRNLDLDFEDVANKAPSDDIKYYQDLMYEIFREVDFSTKNTKFFYYYIRVLLIEVLSIFIGGIILYLFNKHGKRNYQYSGAEGLFAMMCSTLGPCLIASIPAIFMLNLEIVVLLLVNVVKLLLMMRVQLSPNAKFDDNAKMLSYHQEKVRIAALRREQNKNKELNNQDSNEA